MAVAPGALRRSPVRWGIVAWLLLPGAPLVAQSNTQLWYDFEFNYYPRPRLLFVTELGPKVLVSQGSGWNSVDVTPGFEFTPRPWVDLLFFVPFSYTVQEEDLNTFETRVQVGARFIYQPISRLLLRNRDLLEYRHINYLGTDSTANSGRFRFRIEARLALNKPVYGANGMLYGITDAEAFVNLSQDPAERFMNRIRFRLGAGYRFIYNWRVEAIYTLQSSRNTLSGDDLTVDNIFRFRLIHYFAQH